MLDTHDQVVQDTHVQDIHAQVAQDIHGGQGILHKLGIHHDLYVQNYKYTFMHEHVHNNFGCLTSSSIL